MFSTFSQKYSFPVDSKAIMYSEGCIKKIKKEKEKKSYWNKKTLGLDSNYGLLQLQFKSRRQKFFLLNRKKLYIFKHEK